MKKLLALLTLGLIVFVVVYRQRVFLWDPIASVSLDGVKLDHVRVMINSSNDVLVDRRNAQVDRIYLVQNWDKTAKYSLGPLRCIEYLACMTDADHAAGEAVRPGVRGARTPVAGVSMTSTEVDFVDENGTLEQVKLR